MRFANSPGLRAIGLLTVLAAWLLLPVGSAEAQRRRGRDRDRDRDRESSSAEPSDAERRAVEGLLQDVRGTVVYARRERIRRQTLGEWQAVDLGEGEAARWSPDGTRIAVYQDGDVIVMNADGSDRRRLYDDADDLEDGSPIEFHTNGEEILFARRRQGLWSVRIDDGEARKLELPARYTGEPGVSADGTRLVARLDNDLYAVDLTTGRHRKFGRGCGPSLSPSGAWIINNLGSHRQLAIQRWNGDDQRRINADMRPDRSWDDFHWSNHEDYLAVQGERNREEAYVVNVRSGDAVRVTWEGRIRMPDLFVLDAAETDAGEAAGRPAAVAVSPAP